MAEQDGDRGEGAQTESSITIVRKACVAKRKPRRSGIAKVVRSRDAAARRLGTGSGATSRTETSLPTMRRNIVRTPRRSVPVVFAGKGINQTKRHRESEVRRQPRPLLPEKTELKDAPDLLDTAPTTCEDKKISMKPLHRFARDKLPKESVLREIILREKEELSTEQFLDRLDIWLRLMDREN